MNKHDTSSLIIIYVNKLMLQDVYGKNSVVQKSHAHFDIKHICLS